MEAYPPEYVDHNLPLVFISGVARPGFQDDRATSERPESSTKLVRKSPECHSDRSDQFINQLLRWDGSNKPWNKSSLPSPPELMNYKIKHAGRIFYLPSRKAAPMAMPANPEAFPGTQAPSGVLHSPLSPLSPGSPIFPDGIHTPLWFQKHQDQIPSLLISCFDISVNGTEVDIQDIQSDINNIRNTLTRSGYKTRFSVVLLSDRSILQAPELEERLAIIRRNTSLDGKTGLFLMPPIGSPSEMATFVHSMLTTVQPLVVEYYRDLTKHARRKKTRAGTGSGPLSAIGVGSQTLSLSGWNVRYDVKLGTFAEIIQEMDIAERHYSSAIEELFKDDGILETTPSWAPRWNHARLLCDTLALRIIRCRLWTNSTSGAAESWQNYQVRMKSLVDRRGKGCETYAWSTWEARWANVMSQLVHRAQTSELCTSIEMAPDVTWFPAWAKAEKNADRLLPFHNLHHAGYWSIIALSKTRERRQRALQIPANDRVSPSQLPASVAASKNRNYDLYLALQPHEEYPLPGEMGYNYLEDISAVSGRIISSMRSRGQFRLSDEIQLRLGRDYVKAERFHDAYTVLKPLWQKDPWSQDNWNELSLQLLDLTYKCALSESDAETALITSWQLMAISDAKSGVMDINNCLDGLVSGASKADVSINSELLRGPIQISLAFAEIETYVGELLECQLSIKSCANSASTPITLSGVEIQFSGYGTIAINHGPGQTEDRSSTVLHVPSDADQQTIVNSVLQSLVSNLRLAPQQTRVYRIHLQLREAGTIFAEQVLLRVNAAKFMLRQEFLADHISNNLYLYSLNGREIHRRLLTHAQTTRVLVLPKPPKLKIVVQDVKSKRFIGENARLTVRFENEEFETIDGTIIATLIDQSGETVTLSWEVDASVRHDLNLASMTAGSSRSSVLLLSSPSEVGEFPLRIQAEYRLSSDPQTTLVKTEEIDLEFEEPFHAKFELGPRYHEATWPSFFSSPPEGTADVAEGIVQSWHLSSQITCAAQETVILDRVDLLLDTTPLDTLCKIADSVKPNAYEVKNHETRKLEFMFTTQKRSLDDRRPNMIDMSLKIAWRRSDESVVSEIAIPVPRLTLPSSEPRVLLTVKQGDLEDARMMLQYHLENPSLHFLTFSLTLESSDEFTFSEPKFRNLSLAPLSRFEVRYSVLVERKDNADGGETRRIRPILRVLDSYYQKDLQIHPGGPDVRSDEHGIMVDLLPTSRGP